MLSQQVKHCKSVLHVRKIFICKPIFQNDKKIVGFGSGGGGGGGGLASGITGTVGNALSSAGVPGGDIVNSVAGGLGSGGL